MGYLIDRTIQIGSTQYKSGPGRTAYTPWLPTYIKPRGKNFLGSTRIIVLVDMYSKSLAELITMAVRTLPNSTVIGETTYGATGPFTDEEVYKSGPFEVGKLMKVYTSSAKFRYIDNKSYEGKGFPPDINVLFDESKLSNNIDLTLEKAIHDN